MYRNRTISLMLLSVFFLMLSIPAKSQEQMYKAVLLDKQSQKPVSFAHIQNKRTGVVEVSNSFGYFQLALFAKDLLLISAIGYKSVYNIAEVSAKIDTIYMQPTATQLREVLVQEEGYSAENIVKKALENLQSNTYLGNFDADYHLIEAQKLEVEKLENYPTFFREEFGKFHSEGFKEMKGSWNTTFTRPDQVRGSYNINPMKHVYDPDSGLDLFQNLIYLDYRALAYTISDVKEVGTEVIYIIDGVGKKWGKINRYDARKGAGLRYQKRLLKLSNYDRRLYIRESDWAIIQYDFTIEYRYKKSDKLRNKISCALHFKEYEGLLYPVNIQSSETNVFNRYKYIALKKKGTVTKDFYNSSREVRDKLLQLSKFDTVRKSKEYINKLYNVKGGGGKQQIRTFGRSDTYDCGVAEAYDFDYGAYNNLFFHFIPVSYSQSFWAKYKPTDLPPVFAQVYQALDALYPIEQQFREYTSFNIDEIAFKVENKAYTSGEVDLGYVRAYRMYYECYKERFTLNPARQELYYYFLK